MLFLNKHGAAAGLCVSPAFHTPPRVVSHWLPPHPGENSPARDSKHSTELLSSARAQEMTRENLDATRCYNCHSCRVREFVPLTFPEKQGEETRGDVFIKQNSEGLVLASCPPSFSFPRKYVCCSMASSTYSKSFLHVIKRTETSARTRPTSLLQTPFKADINAAPSSPEFTRSVSCSQTDPGVIPMEQHGSSEPCPAPGEGRRPLSLLSSRSHRGVPVRSGLLSWSSDFHRASGDSSRHTGERQGRRERRKKGRKERLSQSPGPGTRCGGAAPHPAPVLPPAGLSRGSQTPLAAPRELPRPRAAPGGPRHETPGTLRPGSERPAPPQHPESAFFSPKRGASPSAASCPPRPSETRLSAAPLPLPVPHLVPAGGSEPRPRGPGGEGRGTRRRRRRTERVRRAVPVTAASCPAPLGAQLLRLATQPCR